MTTIEPTVLLQVDASVIVGVFIFLTILEYKSLNIRPDPNKVIRVQKERLLFPAIIIILFALSACFILIGIPSASYILTFLGFAVIIGAFAYWLINPNKIPYGHSGII